jgi:GT2 family glycosyltransferase
MNPSASPRAANEDRRDVAVIVVNWNSGPLLGDCLSALDRQTLKPRRIIVADNNSTDHSISQVRDRHPAVEVVPLEYNAGFAVANNLAVRMADDCHWIALLNPDAFPEPRWLERLVETGNTHPGYAFFASRLLIAGAEERLDGAGDVYSVNGLAWRRYHGRPSTGTALVVEEVFGPCAAAALYRRDAFLEAGGFDESYFCYFEDIDLAFRLQLAGHRCLYVPEAVVHHVGSASTGRRSDFSIYHGHRNLVWTYVKDMPGPLLAAYLPHHLFLNLVSVLWFVFHGQGRTILKAKWDAVAGLPRAWRQRRQIQAKRRAGIWQLRRFMAGALEGYGFHASTGAEAVHKAC